MTRHWDDDENLRSLQRNPRTEGHSADHDATVSSRATYHLLFRTKRTALSSDRSSTPKLRIEVPTDIMNDMEKSGRSLSFARTANFARDRGVNISERFLYSEYPSRRRRIIHKSDTPLALTITAPRHAAWCSVPNSVTRAPPHPDPGTASRRTALRVRLLISTSGIQSASGSIVLRHDARR